MTTIRHGVACVDGEIEEYHFKLVCIAEHRLAYQWKARLYDDRRTKRTLKQLRHPANKFRDMDGLFFQFLSPCKGKHSLSQRRAPLSSFDCVVKQETKFRII